MTTRSPQFGSTNSTRPTVQPPSVRTGTLSSTRAGSSTNGTNLRNHPGTSSGSSFAQRHAGSGHSGGGQWNDDARGHGSNPRHYSNGSGYWGQGYGGYGYSRYGYRPYGYGLYGSSISRLLFGYGGLGYGGYGYGGYGRYGGYGYPTTTNYSRPTNITLPPTTNSAPPVPPVAGQENYAALGEGAFRNGDYDTAVRQWQHALVDDPQNTTLAMLMAQALFAQGKYEDAAGALQAAMAMMPPERWNVVVANVGELYGDPAKFSAQLAALAAAAAKSPAPAAQFLLGYFHGFLGDPARALKDLDQGMKLQPQDQLMQKLRDFMQAKVTTEPM